MLVSPSSEMETFLRWQQGIEACPNHIKPYNSVFQGTFSVFRTASPKIMLNYEVSCRYLGNGINKQNSPDDACQMIWYFPSTYVQFGVLNIFKNGVITKTTAVAAILISAIETERIEAIPHAGGDINPLALIHLVLQ